MKPSDHPTTRLLFLPTPDRELVLWETIQHLQALIRLESVNPPGNEIGVARYLHDALSKAGIAAELLEPAPGRGAVIARIRGTGKAGGALMLMAHMDVVGVEREKWRQHPFGGEIADGYLYGRGAIDDKGMLATNLQTMLQLQRTIDGGGRLPDRDLVFLATSDEEAGGKLGIEWVLEHHRDKVDAEVALNEGGRVRVVGGKRLYAAIQCAEKVPHNVTVTARGPGGHAAVPHQGNAIVRLARALARIAAHEEPTRLTAITRSFFEGVSVVWPQEELRTAMADVASDDDARVARGVERLREVPSMDAILRTGISPTLIKGGLRANVIPTEAEANLNIRTLPDETIDEVVARLRAACDDPAIEFAVRSSGRVAPASPIDAPAYRAITAALQAVDPQIRAVPFLSTGATDSAALRRIGISCYGLLPFPLTEDDESRMHGHDERVGVDALGFGLWVTCRIVDELLLGATG